MTYRNTETYYGSVAKFLHWLIFFLILIMLIVGFFMDDIANEYLKEKVYNLHKLTGIVILALMIFRALWALSGVKPVLPAGTPPWQRSAEHITHFLIYLALICMPIAGWVTSVAAGYSPHFLGYSLSLPIEPNKPLSKFAGDMHFYLAWAIIVLISIHALAALYHHFVKKDDVLVRMLP